MHPADLAEAEKMLREVAAMDKGRMEKLWPMVVQFWSLPGRVSVLGLIGRRPEAHSTYGRVIESALDQRTF
jgi:hypothetical protein